jgi:hypothetical protein
MPPTHVRAIVSLCVSCPSSLSWASSLSYPDVRRQSVRRVRTTLHAQHVLCATTRHRWCQLDHRRCCPMQQHRRCYRRLRWCWLHRSRRWSYRQQRCTMARIIITHAHAHQIVPVALVWHRRGRRWAARLPSHPTATQHHYVRTRTGSLRARSTANKPLKCSQTFLHFNTILHDVE